jgi:hypothetical protein
MLSGNKPSSVGILLTSHDPTRIPDSLLTHAEFILSSPFPWLYGFCRNYWPSTGQAFRTVRRDQVMVISPDSIVMDTSTGTTTKWGQVPLIIDLDMMVKEVEKGENAIVPKGRLETWHRSARSFPLSIENSTEVQPSSTLWISDMSDDLDGAPQSQSQRGLVSVSEEV